jgi:hypothetical protein
MKMKKRFSHKLVYAFIFLVSSLSLFFLIFKIREQQDINSRATQGNRRLFSSPESYEKLHSYPLVGQLAPDVEYMLSQYNQEKTALILARYDAIVVTPGSLNPQTISVWERVFELNSDLVLAFQISAWDKPNCDSTDNQQRRFRGYINGLGNFANRIDIIELDGSSGLANTCGQEKMREVIVAYKALLQELNLSAYITINGAAFPRNDALCEYQLATDKSGSAQFDSMPDLINGKLSEGWIASAIRLAYYKNNPNGYNLAKGRIDEACAWINSGQQPAFVWAYYEMPTPWWPYPVEDNPSNKPHAWKNMRLAFTASQMVNNVIFIYNPTNQMGLDHEINPEKVFWGDYYSVGVGDGLKGLVPSYGDNLIKSTDDSLAIQRRQGGYLGQPQGKPTISVVNGGTFFAREFDCGYVYTNLSPHAVQVTPDEATKKVLGRQDRNYDDGSRADSYSVPEGDGLVLLKISCISN